jgi:hypothetical protein
MARTRGKVDNPDRLITARLMATAFRLATRNPVDGQAALAEIAAIAGDRSDLLAEGAGLLIGWRSPRREITHDWPAQAVAGSLPVAAGADLSVLDHWIRVGMQQARELRVWGNIPDV